MKLSEKLKREIETQIEHAKQIINETDRIDKIPYWEGSIMGLKKALEIIDWHAQSR